MTVEFINPCNGMLLHREGDALVDDTGTSFPIISEIPRFCSGANYADNFGKQWNWFPRTQIDTDLLSLSKTRFFAETGWEPDQLAGLDILEVGSGAGRFSRVVLDHTAATLYSLDYSNAVEANLSTNGQVADGRFNVCQASIYELPFRDGSFDRVFCMGVLQHTPDFEASVRALAKKAKPGGEIVIDFYPIRGWWTKVSAKYILRPITKKLKHNRLLQIIEANVDWLIKTHAFVTRLGLGFLTRFLPLVDLRLLPPTLTREQLREWAVLDTFDMFSPEYDNPQRIKKVVEMFRRAGATVTFADYVQTGTAYIAVVRASGPAVS
jgi:2-polyprenyl-3-methyl-5-hydroxy-6-metoxy-1,4-benzoquinol methylase